jgi:hypothetical protein
MDELDVKGIQVAVRKRYAELDGSIVGRFAYPTGRAGALTLGYEAPLLDAISDQTLAAFCGVGNPFALGPMRAGSMSDAERASTFSSRHALSGRAGRSAVST